MPHPVLGACETKGIFLPLHESLAFHNLSFRLSLFVLGNGTLCRNCVLLGHASEILARHVMGENVAW